MACQHKIIVIWPGNGARIVFEVLATRFVKVYQLVGSFFPLSKAAIVMSTRDSCHGMPTDMSANIGVGFWKRIISIIFGFIKIYGIQSLHEKLVSFRGIQDRQVELQITTTTRLVTKLNKVGNEQLCHFTYMDIFFSSGQKP
jgi:hypothetical protein